MNYVYAIKEDSQIEQMKQVLLSDKLHGQRNYILFLLGIYSGYRISDILKLKVSDVYNKKYFEIIENKTGKLRKRIIHPELKEELNLYIESNKLSLDSYLFPSQKHRNEITVKTIPKKTKRKKNSKNTGEYITIKNKAPNSPITRKTAWEILNKAAKEIGITDNIGTHSLRKTFGNKIYKNTGDLVLTQQAIGHSNSSIGSTKRYLGIDQAEIDNAIMNCLSITHH